MARYDVSASFLDDHHDERRVWARTIDAALERVLRELVEEGTGILRGGEIVAVRRPWLRRPRPAGPGRSWGPSGGTTWGPDDGDGLDPGDDGGAGVREPRRPRPTRPSAALALEAPVA